VQPLCAGAPINQSSIPAAILFRGVVLLIHHSTGGSPAVVVASLDALSTAATHDAAPAGWPGLLLSKRGSCPPWVRQLAAPFFKLAD